MGAPGERPGRGEALFAVLIRLYPSNFRAEFSDELLAFFGAEKARERYRRRFGGVVFWFGVLRDLIPVATRLRFGQLQHAFSTRGQFGAGGNPYRKELMSKMAQDIRYALRTLAKAPGFTAIAVLTLGIGIGSAAAVFNAVDVFMLRPLPYPDSHDLVSIDTRAPDRDWGLSTSAPDFFDLREASSTMEAAAYDYWGYNLAGDFRPERVDAMKVSGNFFSVLGRTPMMGRTFTTDEDLAGSTRSAIISHRLWQRRFGGDPDILAKTIILDGATHEIVGVMPERFWFIRPGVDVWAPLAVSEEQAGQRDWRSFGVLARIGDGYNQLQAMEEARLISAGLTEAYPETNTDRVFAVTSLHEEVFDEGFKSGTSIGSLAMAFVLLIACANVANLVLARSAGRTREIALRTALGAGRIRILSQLFTESLLVALLGGVVGLGVAWMWIQGLLSIFPSWFPRVDEIGLDSRAILFAMALALITAVIFGLYPALQSSRPNLTESLKEGGRSNSGGGGKLRKALVVTEMALALVLVISSALLVKGFLQLRGSDYGFETRNVLMMRFDLAGESYQADEQVHAFYREAFERIAAIRGVDAVGMIHRVPRTGNSSVFYSMPGDDVEGNDRPVVATRWIAGDYFSAMGIPVMEGRVFTETDAPGSQRTVVVNELMADRHWPEGAVGQTFNLTSGPVEIIGVVGNTADVQPEPLSMIYLSAVQDPIRYAAFVVRADSDPMSIAEQAIGEVQAMNPNLPLWDISTLDDFMAVQDGGNSVMSKIMSVVALQALVLSIVGVYGVMTYSVSQRTQEIGVRMALGASNTRVLGMVVRQGAGLAALGILVGLGMSALVTRTLSFFLFGVSPFDAATFVSVTAVLFLSGLVASAMPAYRATRVDPMQTLRTE